MIAKTSEVKIAVIIYYTLKKIACRRHFEIAMVSKIKEILLGTYFTYQIPL